jgi:hypothetical protein
MIVASFWVHRPAEFPDAADYPAMLRILQRSCDRLKMPHVCLTDIETKSSPLWPEGVWPFVATTPGRPLLRASPYEGDILFVGADCIMKREPVYPDDVDVGVTYRRHDSKYPINTGAVFVRARAREEAAKLFRRIADRCGATWCDDQRAIRAELEPMPPVHGVFMRGGLRVGFMPMKPYNVLPRDEADSAGKAYVVHFRGRRRKQLLFNWAERWGYA